MNFRYFLLLLLLGLSYSAHSESLGSSEESNESFDSSEVEKDEGETEKLPPMDLKIYPDIRTDPDVVIKLNKLVDLMIDGVKAAFGGQVVIPLLDIDDQFGAGFFKGHFVATSGYFRDPSSLQRTGDVELSVVGTNVSFEVALGLAVTEGGFKNYTFDIIGTHEAGDIKISIAHNSLVLKNTLTFPKCSVELDYVKFDQLDGVEVAVTGLGPFQNIFDSLTKWLIENFQPQLTNDLNNLLYKMLDEQVAKFSDQICSVFPH